MANITVSVYQAGRTATSSANYTDNKTAATTGNTYYIANNGHVGVILECTAGGTATFVTTGTIDSLSVTDLTVTTTAAKVLIWGGFPGTIYNDGNGTMQVTVSAATNLFAFRLA
jgi:hypothetical protein